MLDCLLEQDVQKDCGYIHEDELPDLQNLRENIQGMMIAMYTTGDVAVMESCLDEVCTELDIKINPGTPIVEKKGQRNLLTWYMGYQRATIDSMHNKTLTNTQGKHHAIY